MCGTSIVRKNPYPDLGGIYGNKAIDTTNQNIKAESKIEQKSPEKESANKIKDSIKDIVKTPQGKAIVAGLIVTPIAPIVGAAVVAGGAAAAAINHIKNSHHETKASEANQQKEGSKYIKNMGDLYPHAGYGGQQINKDPLHFDTSVNVKEFMSAGKNESTKEIMLQKSTNKVNDKELKWALELEQKVKNGHTPNADEIKRYTKLANDLSKNDSSNNVKQFASEKPNHEIKASKVNDKDTNWALDLESKVKNGYKPNEDEIKKYGKIAKEIMKESDFHINVQAGIDSTANAPNGVLWKAAKE